MQKKALTGIMILAVVGIWGYVGFRFFAGMEQDEELSGIEYADEQVPSPLKIDTQQKLKLNYTDPFLKTDHSAVIIRKLPLAPKKVEKKTVPPVPQITVNWPVISYKGLIKNQNHPEKLLGLILINGKERIIRKGETVEEMQVTGIDKAKVELLLGKEKRVFLK